MASSTAPIRIANCSGFYGDRMTAAREQVMGGPIDALTGDWLAELTMLILAKAKAAGRGGFARTFVTQMEEVMGTCLDRGIKVVANAGGLDPQGCAEAVQTVADKLGLAPKIAYVRGDDLLDRIDGFAMEHLETGEPFGNRTAMSANAYLGCWGIVRALNDGADIVVTGRATDAAIVMAPAAWKHGWSRTDWDSLAGACVAGHVIECGAQATGGNYSFFQDIPGLEHAGFPIAEVAADGSCVITKHPGTGGLVTVGTVTAQLLYEITGPRYANPDVVCRFDTIRLDEDGPDRVRISGTRGEPAPPTLKVSVNYEGGYRNQSVFCLTGLDIEEKAALVERTFWAGAGGREQYAYARTELRRTHKENPATNEEAVADLIFTVKDPDSKKVGRRFANAGVEMALASYPGMFGRGGPSEAQPYGVFWPALVPADSLRMEVGILGGPTVMVDNTIGPFGEVDVAVPADAIGSSATVEGDTVVAPLGRVIGARSGDKGGNANLGTWARSDEGYAWMRDTLTIDRLRALMPEVRDLEVRRYEFTNIRALNFVIVGLLEDGVASSTRMDPQAKGLGEYLRSKHVPVPTRLLPKP